MPYTVNLDQIYFETSASSDPKVTGSWSNPVLLRSVAEGAPPELQYWHASEHLIITSSAEYLAAWDDNASAIDIKGVFPPSDASVDSFRLDCPSISGVGTKPGLGSEVRMSVASIGALDPRREIRLDLPEAMPVMLAIYDVAGRRRSLLVDGDLPRGRTTLLWGEHMTSGVYFVRLTYSRGARLSKIVLLR
jgi:hypothetical protein